MTPTTTTADVIRLREAWLLKLAELMQPAMIGAARLEFPQYRVTCGFPSRGGLAKKKRVVGQCWSAKASSDRHAEIFVTPLEDNPEEVASTLAHELIHACLPEAGHKAPFARAAKALGFKAPWTSTPETDEFWAWVRPLLAQMPAYPHGRLHDMAPVAAPKPQKGRLLKAECACGYTVRITRKWVVEAGPPHCPQHGAMCVDLGDDAGEED